MDPCTDRELLRRWRAGDRPALAAFCARHLDLAWRHARALSGSEADADDAVQVAFERICRRAGQFRRGDDARGWVLAIVANACRDAARARYRRELRHAALAQEPAMETAPAPEAPLVDAEEAELVRRAIDELPEPYRHPLRLHHLEGLEIADVAEALGRPRKTVESQLGRGRGLLRDILLRRGLTAALLALPLGSLLAAAGPGAGAPAALAATVQGAVATAAVPAAAILPASAIPLKGAVAVIAISALLVVGLVALPTAVPAPDPTGQAPAVVAPMPADPPADPPEDRAAWPDRPIAVTLVRATVKEALQGVTRELGGPGLPLPWSFPWDDPWHLTTPLYGDGGPFVTLGGDPRPAKEVLDAIAAQTGLAWRAHRGHLVLLERLPDDAEALRARYGVAAAPIADRCAAAAALARAGEVPAMAWLIRQAMAADDRHHPAVRWVERRLQGLRMRGFGGACHLALADVDAGLVAAVAARWDADDPLLAGLGAALGADSPAIRRRLVEVLGAPPPQRAPPEGGWYRSDWWSSWRTVVHAAHVEALMQRDPGAGGTFVPLLTAPGTPVAGVHELCGRFQRLRYAPAAAAFERLLAGGPHRQAAAVALLAIDFDAYHETVARSLAPEVNALYAAFIPVDDARAVRLLVGDRRITDHEVLRLRLPQVLASHADPEARRALEGWLAGGDRALRTAAARALGAQGHAAALAVLEREGIPMPTNVRLADEGAYGADVEVLRSSTDAKARSLALQRLGYSRTDAGIAALLAALDDPRLGGPALTLIGPYAATRAAVRRRLLAMLADPDRTGDDRAKVVQALRHVTGLPDVLPWVVASLEGAADDTDFCIGLLSSVNTLHHLVEAGDDAVRSRVAGLVVDLTAHADPRVADRARSIIGILRRTADVDLEAIAGRPAAPAEPRPVTPGRPQPRTGPKNEPTPREDVDF